MRLSTYGGPTFHQACVFQSPIAKETCQQGIESCTALSVGGEQYIQYATNQRQVGQFMSTQWGDKSRVWQHVLGLHDLHASLLTT